MALPRITQKEMTEREQRELKTLLDRARIAHENRVGKYQHTLQPICRHKARIGSGFAEILGPAIIRTPPTKNNSIAPNTAGIYNSGNRHHGQARRKTTANPANPRCNA